MSENLEHKRNQNPRETAEAYKSRDQLNQPKGKFEDLFRTAESNREPSKPSNTEKPPESERSGQMTPSRTEAPADE